jgi:sugar porter (SP) family MFS transporter
MFDGGHFRPINSNHQSNPAYVWLVCIIAALGGLLFGYDTAVIADAIGYLQQHFNLTPALKGWASSAILLGCMIGVSFAGVFSDRLGRKRTLVLAGVLFLASSLGTALPKTLTVFILFRVLAGVGVGIASLASPMYIAEISPARSRGRMVSVNQFAIVTGILLTYFANYAIAHHGTEVWNVTTGWRWMFGLGAAPALVLLGMLWFAPESPRWLVEQGRREEARKILTKVDGPLHAEAELVAIEEVLKQETGRLSQLLKPGLRRALVIGILLAILQQITGINVFLYYAPEIFKKLGAHADVALLQTVVVGAVNVLFTILAIWTVDRLGRKPLMAIGAAGMGVCLLAIGLASQQGAITMWVLAFILGYIACFALSVGPVTWVILSEIFPTSIRGRALSVATLCLWGADFVVTQTFPMMDESPWLVTRFNHAFPFYVYAVFCVVLLLVVAFLVPETKGRSLEEIEKSWQRSADSESKAGNAPARTINKQ